jgi:hypothetical protein
MDLTISVSVTVQHLLYSAVKGMDFQYLTKMHFVIREVAYCYALYNLYHFQFLVLNLDLYPVEFII